MEKKPSIQEEIANDKAQDINNEIANCMTDYAMGGGEFDYSDYEKLYAEAVRLYNDIGTMRDLVGDRIYWACGNLQTDENKMMGGLICDSLIKIGHSALKEAVINFKKDQNL